LLVCKIVVYLPYKILIIMREIKFYKHLNILDSGQGHIFDNGIWAEIIQPKQMTKEEIEKELGYEIEIKL